MNEDLSELDPYALFEADVAFMKARREGETQSNSVRAALKAYINALTNPKVIDLSRHFGRDENDSDNQVEKKT